MPPTLSLDGDLRRLRVSVVVDGSRVAAAIARTIDLVAAAPVDLVSIHVQPVAPRLSLGSRLVRAVDWVDRVLTRSSPDAFRLVALDGRHGERMSRPMDQAWKDSLHDLDVLLDLTTDGFAPQAPAGARLGTWSLRYGDERLILSRSTFAREFMNGSEAAIAELVADQGSSADAPEGSPRDVRVLYHSVGAIDRHSPARTRNAVMWKAAELPARVLTVLTRGGPAAVVEPDPSLGSGGRPISAPDVALLAAIIVARALREAVRRVVARPGWIVAIRAGRPASTGWPADLREFRPLMAPAGRFYADPFVVRGADDVHLFVEDAPIGGGPGRITTLALDHSGRVRSGPLVVLERPTHLSYPFVFEDGEDWYMLPETSGTRTVELFRARDFPGDWVPHAVLLRDIHAWDPTLLHHDGLYWLFATVAVLGASPSDELCLYWSDSLTGPWHPHPQNPVVSDARHARPAGRILVDEGTLIRPAQDCTGGYGRRIVLNRIEILTKDNYRETPISAIEPHWAPGVFRTHTYTADGGIEALDGLRYQRRLRFNHSFESRSEVRGAATGDERASNGTEPRRLLMLTTSMARGGAERQVVDLAAEFRARGWAVLVLSMTTPTDYVDELAAAGVEVLDLGMTRGRPTLAALLRYRSFVRRWRPDIVHSHMVHANLLARVGRVFALSIPVVCTVHTVREGSRWRVVAYRLTDRLASATTAVSRAVAARSVRTGAVPRGRILVIPNGFSFVRARVADGAAEALRDELAGDEAFLWVTVGRLVPEKGHAMLLRAFDAVHRARPNARLAIAGDGPERSHLEGLIAELGLGGSAFLLGERRDVAALLLASHAFVLSSHWEGMPMALLEAAAQSLPIVATDVGGCREVVKPELGGILTGTSPESIASGMLSVMSLDKEERTRIGGNLRNLVQTEFEMRMVAGRWEELYDNFITR